MRCHLRLSNGDACSCATYALSTHRAKILRLRPAFDSPSSWKRLRTAALISATACFAFNAIIMEWSPAGAREACGIETVEGRTWRGNCVSKPLISADGEDDSPREVVGAAPPRVLALRPVDHSKAQCLKASLRSPERSPALLVLVKSYGRDLIAMQQVCLELSNLQQLCRVCLNLFPQISANRLGSTKSTVGFAKSKAARFTTQLGGVFRSERFGEEKVASLTSFSCTAGGTTTAMDLLTRQRMAQQKINQTRSINPTTLQTWPTTSHERTSSRQPGSGSA